MHLFVLCSFFFFVFPSTLYPLWRSLAFLPLQISSVSVNGSGLFVEFAKRSVIHWEEALITGYNVGANKLCAYFYFFFKSKSKYKDFAVNCKISQSRLACRCCTFSLPHDIFLTKSIIYMGFKFNLNVMNLNWALLYFKVVGLLFRKLTFSTRDSTGGFGFQLLSLALLPPPPFLSLSHLPKSNPAPLPCGP